MVHSSLEIMTNIKKIQEAGIAAREALAEIVKVRACPGGACLTSAACRSKGCSGCAFLEYESFCY